MFHRIVLIVLVCLIAACGSSSPAAPSIAQVGGVWTGNVTQTGATSTTGECLAFFQQSNGGSDRYTVSITQTGSDLTATASSQSSGQSCNYTGTAGATTVSLNATACNPVGYAVVCNGLARDVVINARSVTGTVSGNTISGTTGETWNVVVHNTSTPVGIVTVNNTFSIVK